MFSEKVKDISEFLVDIDWQHNMGKIARRVAYHDACHLAHGQKIRQQPRHLLQAIPGITLVDLKESDWCCGSAGVYNITNQEMAAELLERKMNNIAETVADTIATGNPGCIMQIAMGIRQRGLEMEVVHPVQLLDEAYRAGGLYSLPEHEIAPEKRHRQALLLGAIIGMLIGILFLRRLRRRK